jgi:hypothetical protein
LILFSLKMNLIFLITFIAGWFSGSEGQNQFDSSLNYNNFFTHISSLRNITLEKPFEMNLNDVHKAFSTYDSAYLFKQLNITVSCHNQLLLLAIGLKNKELWSLKVVDSFGKPPSGFLLGSFNWFGEITECRSVSSNIKDYNNNTKIMYKYGIIAPPSTQMDMFERSDKVKLKYGICFPKACSVQDTVQIVNSLLKILKETITTDYIIFKEDKSIFDDKLAVAGLCVLIFIVSIVLLGTLIDFYKRYLYNFQLYSHQEMTISLSGDETSENSNEQNEIDFRTNNSNDGFQNDKQDLLENKEINYKVYLANAMFPVRLFASFSIWSNTKSIFNLSETKDELSCLNGIRVLSLGWIIFGHVFILSIVYSNNLLIVNDWLKSFSFLLVSNSFFSVDSFFLLSGLLTAYIFMKEFKKRNESNELNYWFILKYYIHRYWRISAPYFLMILFSASLSPFLGSGPIYPEDGFEPNRCRSNWWTNVLYLNNFIKVDTMCFAVAWYLANDMQFHWFAPIILIPFAYGKYIMGCLLAILVMICSSVSIIVTLLENPGMEMGQFGFGGFNFKV